METAEPVYTRSAESAESALRQGEIITGLIQITFDIQTLGSDSPSISTIEHPYALIVSQDCDLEQDFRANRERVASDKEVPNILFCEVRTADELREKIPTGSKFWNTIKTNKNERFHFLQAVNASSDRLGTGLPEFGVDFKRFFSVPTLEVYARIRSGEAQRRCVLASPYLEHFASRFAYFLSRVALPHDHEST